MRPIDSSPLGSSVPGTLQARILEWVAISFSNAWKWKLKWSRSVVSDSATPWTVAHQAPPSMQFSRQEYWNGLPLPSPAAWTMTLENLQIWWKNALKKIPYTSKKRRQKNLVLSWTFRWKQNKAKLSSKVCIGDPELTYVRGPNLYHLGDPENPNLIVYLKWPLFDSTSRCWL